MTPVFQHRQPFWFFGPIVVIALLPWSLLLRPRCRRRLAALANKNFARFARIFLRLLGDISIFLFQPVAIEAARLHPSSGASVGAPVRRGTGAKNRSEPSRSTLDLRGTSSHGSRTLFGRPARRLEIPTRSDEHPELASPRKNRAIVWRNRFCCLHALRAIPISAARAELDLRNRTFPGINGQRYAAPRGNPFGRSILGAQSRVITATSPAVQ